MLGATTVFALQCLCEKSLRITNSLGFTRVIPEARLEQIFPLEKITTLSGVVQRKTHSC